MVDFVYKENYKFEDLIRLVEVLRKECPWDREQTHRSIRRNLLEEAYEAAEAIDLEDDVLLKEELGDVLLQVVFHSSIEAETGRFDIHAVSDGVCKKLIERHPHIFLESSASTPAEVLAQWDLIKRKQKGQAKHSDAIDTVAKSLPALWRAEKIIQKAEKAAFGFSEDLLPAARFAELCVAPDSGLSEESFGDFLFAAVRLAYLAGVDPERSLELACDRFSNRFRALEDKRI